MTVNQSYSTCNEFRSDTFTVPSAAMLNSIAASSFGDSVYQEDQSTLALENKMCLLTGKEAALFCVSGTLSNQIGLRAVLQQPPYSILCDYRAHVFLHEAGGLALLSQAMVHPVQPRNGRYLTVEDVVENFTPDDGDIHAAPTKVISLENTLHGMVMPVDEIAKIAQFARENGVVMHLDGARLWNAAAETGVSLKEWCSHFDTVSLCLSKSIGAPVGSVLVGEARVIAKANHFKKQAGGGIRQAGILASMAMTAIDENFGKLKQTHQWAKDVGRFCEDHGIALECPVDTNFVFIDVEKNGMYDGVLIKMGAKKNLRLMGKRLAFHYQLSEDSVEALKTVILECFQQLSKTSNGKPVSKKKFYNFDALKSSVP